MFALSEHGATSSAARWLAQRENEADLIGGVNLDNREPMLAKTLLDLSQTAQINDSLRVGRSVLDGIGAINALHKGSVEQAGFAVLKAPDIPSILVETAFISNPDEELKCQERRAPAALRRVDHRRRQALLRAEPAARPRQGRAERPRVQSRPMIRFFVLFLVLQAALFGLELTPWAQEWFVVPWTNTLAAIRAGIVKIFDPQVIAQGNVLQSTHNGFAVSIEAGCNGVEATIVLVAAILAFPAPWKRKLARAR